MTVSLTSTPTVYAGAGFACWGLDSLACSRLRQLRRQIGMPWGFALELHGWYGAVIDAITLTWTLTRGLGGTF